MKKILAVLLALSVLFAFAACGNKGDIPSDETTVSETTEPQTTEKVKPEPVKLIDDEYLTLTVNDAYADKELGYVLKVVIENKGDEDYFYSVDSCSINGVSVDAFFYAEVKAGKKAVEKIEISDFVLGGTDIGEYTDIEMKVTVNKDILEDAVATRTVHYYPQGADKAVKYVRQPAATDKILVDNAYITLTATGMSHDDDFEATELCLYIVNKSDKDLTIEAGSVSVNDVMLDPYYTDTVASGKVKFSVLSWDDFELEEKEIEEIEKIEMEISAYSEMDYLEMLENIDLEDLFSEDGGLFDDMSLFSQSVTYQPVK